MTEIRTTVDLRHPPERVWRALTDPELLSKWFGSVEPRPSSISRFVLRPVDLPELAEVITVQLLEVDPPSRLVLRWPEGDQSTRVVCELTGTAEGCRLTVVQADPEEPELDTDAEAGWPGVGDEEPWRATDAEESWPPHDLGGREECYQQLLDTRLPAVLDWVAFREVELPEAAATAGLVTATAATERRSRARLVAGLATLALVVGAVVVVAGLARGRSDSDAARPPTTAASPTPTTGGPVPASPTGTPAAGAVPVQPSRSAQPTPRRTPDAAPRPARPGQPNLTAQYATTSTRLLGYEGQVVVTNDGDAPAREWTVVITLPSGAEVSAADGATFRQEEERVTFTGTALPADRSATIRFAVQRDATLTHKRPLSCVVQSRPCDGL